MSRCLNDCVALIGGDGWTANNDPFVLNDRHNRLHLSGAVCVLPSFFSGFSFFFWFVSRSLSLSLSLPGCTKLWLWTTPVVCGRLAFRVVSSRASATGAAWRRRRLAPLPKFTEFHRILPLVSYSDSFSVMDQRCFHLSVEVLHGFHKNRRIERVSSGPLR